MFEAFMRLLLFILGVALCIVLAVWVLDIVGFVIPATAIKIIIAMAVIVVIIYAYRLLWVPHISGKLP
jgi:hypothetical protein